MDYMNMIPMKNGRQLKIRGANTRMSLAIGSFKSQESEVRETAFLWPIDTMWGRGFRNSESHGTWSKCWFIAVAK